MSNIPPAATTAAAPRRRLDYRPPPFLVPRIELVFDLDLEATEVAATLHFERNPDAHPDDRTAPLVLDGEAQTLLRVLLNGAPLDGACCTADADRLTIAAAPASGTLTVVSRNAPARNTALEGLYVSSGVFCTQCEAEGFRRITYFPDRPDVLSRFSVTLRAGSDFPVLLSNGNRVAQGTLDDGRHFARWEDPFPKPCYLFALVAGDLAALRDSFVTASGRRVALEIYSTENNIPRCAYAMDALKRAMRWDETRYRREYDLDRFMIFCADDFNMGAMENKGLNIFNSRLVLADPATATDDDYHAIESVIAHEYFHNWTGDRVTCRDWFQLSLKEGLTVFRDQQFSADMGSAAAERIAVVDFLRKRQFPEDAGPTAHPVRPDEYREINNFYTMTVYEKGAEVIRMQHTLLGEAAFQRGMDLYFERHDGQAVTCDDFVQAMQDASHIDLTQFRLWYSQAGTPVVHARGRFDADSRSYTLHLRQHTAPTPGQPDKVPLMIPIAVGLLDDEGRDVPLAMADDDAAPETRVLLLAQREQNYRFENIDTCPTPSLLRGGSAPVRLEYDYSERELRRLAQYDSDPVNRWDAAQRCLAQALTALAKSPGTALSGSLIALYAALLDDDAGDPALRALALTLPDLSALLSLDAGPDAPFPVEAFVEARSAMERMLAETLDETLARVFERYRVTAPYAPDAAQAARRRLRGHALALLCADRRATVFDTAVERAAALYRGADNMTDVFAALTALRDVDHPLRDALFGDFEERWRGNALVLDKWFALEAASARPGALARVETLLSHPAFSLKNPNRVRAVLGSFGQRNFAAFHSADGSGYRWLAGHIGSLDALNPHVASMLLAAFNAWKNLAEPQRGQARQALEKLAGVSRSPEVSELLDKLLAA